MGRRTKTTVLRYLHRVTLRDPGDNNDTDYYRESPPHILSLFGTYLILVTTQRQIRLHSDTHTLRHHHHQIIIITDIMMIDKEIKTYDNENDCYYM